MLVLESFVCVFLFLSIVTKVSHFKRLFVDWTSINMSLRFTSLQECATFLKSEVQITFSRDFIMKM